MSATRTLESPLGKILVEAIEALYRYDTGLTPPLTYGPNRRIGAMGAHVMRVDVANQTKAPVGTWQEVR